MKIFIPMEGGDLSKRELRCRKTKTAEICEMLGYEYDGSCWAHYGDGDDTPAAYLVNGCLSLYQALSIADKLNIYWSDGWMLGLETITIAEDQTELDPLLDAIVKALKKKGETNGKP